MQPYEKRLSKVETLKLAISYISFLNELVTTGRNPAENAAIKRNQDKIRQTVIQYHRNKDGVQLTKHILSWNFEHDSFQNGNLVLARTWTPEDPSSTTETKLKSDTDKTDDLVKNHGSLTDANSEASLISNTSGFNSGFTSSCDESTTNLQSNRLHFVDSSGSLNDSPINYMKSANQSNANKNFVSNEPMEEDNPNFYLTLNNGNNECDRQLEHLNSTFNTSTTSANLANSVTNTVPPQPNSSNCPFNSSPNRLSSNCVSDLLSGASNSTQTTDLTNHKTTNSLNYIVPDQMQNQIYTNAAGVPSSTITYTSHSQSNSVFTSTLNQSNYSDYNLIHMNQSNANHINSTTNRPTISPSSNQSISSNNSNSSNNHPNSHLNNPNSTDHAFLNNQGSCYMSDNLVQQFN